MNNNIIREDTITAVATPSGVGAISVIRVSGPETIRIVDKIFVGKKNLIEAVSHTIHYGKIKDETNNLIDDVLVSVFIAPNSYTGEDSIEISSHGSSFITKRIIEILVNNGIRIAEPGEFTKRAYLNNRLDLAQAEAVLDIINSRTEASLLGARNQLDGLLSSKVQDLRKKLLDSASFVELELDFAEEDIELIKYSELINRIEEIIFEIDKLINTYNFGKVIRDGVNVALVGKPNVGKSSLLNYILKESRAIVSPIPGTTRDVIREEISIDGILFRLYDTAGIRLSDDEIEKEGVLRSRNVVKSADIVLLIEDIFQNGSDELFKEIASFAKPEKVLKVVNKIDLEKNITKTGDIYISALTGEGIELLFSKLKEASIGNSSYTEKSALVSNLRHYDCLRKAKENLQNSLKTIDNKLSGEFIAVDIRNAVLSLGEIIGEVSSEDVLNNIFSKFCIGK
jgi:tRNA modification GTPase